MPDEGCSRREYAGLRCKNERLLAIIAGIGSCFAAAIYEVGRPARLSSNEAMQLENQWQNFGKHSRSQSSHWLCNAIWCPTTCYAPDVREGAPSYDHVPVFTVSDVRFHQWQACNVLRSQICGREAAAVRPVP